MAEMSETEIYNLLRTEPYNTQFIKWRKATYGLDLPADQGNAAWFYSNGYRTVESIVSWFASVGYPITTAQDEYCYGEGYIKYGNEIQCCAGLEPVWDETVHPSSGGEYVCKKTASSPGEGSGTPNIIIAAGILIGLSILYSLFAKR